MPGKAPPGVVAHYDEREDIAAEADVEAMRRRAPDVYQEVARRPIGARPALAASYGPLRPRWQYAIVQPTAPDKATDLAADLNKLGAEGWELVTADAGNLYFKRAAQ